METRIQGMTDLIGQSLSIKYPWYVRNINADYENKRVDIYIDTHDLIEMECPECGKICKRAGYEKAERVWQHGDVCFTPTYVHCRRPRVRCPEHGTKVVLAPWARKNTVLTYRMESYAIELMKDLPRRRAAMVLRCSEKSLVKALNYWVEKAVAEDNLSNVSQIAVDETSFKKGQHYVTVIIDAKERRVIDVEEGRNAETIDRFSRKLEEKHGHCNGIMTFCADMSPAYKSGCEMCFPKAKLVIDKFHVKQLMIKGMEEVRKTEQGKFYKSRQSGKQLLMIPETRMRENQREALKKLSSTYPKTGRSYRMIQVLDEMFRSGSEDDARSIFTKLINWMRRSRLEPMKKVAKTLQNRKEEILAYFRMRVTNAIAEGINSMIQAAKRKARGYKTIRGYISMIYLVAGKLKLSCPCVF